MKALLLTFYSVLSYIAVIHAQSYEHMYKKQITSDTIANTTTNKPHQIADTVMQIQPM